MTLSAQSPFFAWEYLSAKCFGVGYVCALVLVHALLPSAYVWDIALFFLIAMLFTYPIAAAYQKQAEGLEVGVAASLAVLGVVGYLVTPWLIILGIVLHGVWDLAKFRGAGAPFFNWYTLGCVCVDFCYAAALSFIAWNIL